MQPDTALSRRFQRCKQFCGGTAWLLVLTWVESESAGISFLAMLPRVLGIAALGSAIALFWLADSGWQLNVRPRQFRLRSVLLATTLAALFLAVVRWHFEFARVQLSPNDQRFEVLLFLAIAVWCVIGAVISLPLLLGLLDSLIWLAAWLLRRPSIRRLLGWSMARLHRIP